MTLLKNSVVCKKTLIIEMVAVVILCSIAIWYLGIVLRPSDVDSCMVFIDAFHEYPEQSLDVVVYGSSHPFNGVNPVQMKEEFGIEAYNYSCYWQQINTTKLFLLDSLRTQSPKIALIETYRVDDVIYDENMDGEVYYTKAIDDFAGKREYLKQCFQNNKLRYVSYYIPFVSVHDNWMNFKVKNLSMHTAPKRDYRNRGLNLINEVRPVTIDKSQLSHQKELPLRSKEVLDDIMEICSEHNIQVVFFVIPFAEEEYCYSDAMKQYALENECTYLDGFDKINEIGLDVERDYNDIGHLNSNGAEKMTRYLSEYILENYDIDSE